MIQIGDLPTRFKYQKTAPLDFGLSPAEILMSTDAELNQFLGMKHFAPYRHGSGVGSAGRGMRDRLKELKSRLRDRKWGEEVVEHEAKGGAGAFGSKTRDSGWGGAAAKQGAGTGEKKKRIGKKERQKRQKAAAAAAAASGAEGSGLAGDEAKSGQKRKLQYEEDGETSKRPKQA